MFKVNELLKATKARLIHGPRDLDIKGVSIDSRTIAAGDAFIAIKGHNFDGHDFINQAINKGAVCIIVRTPYPAERCRNKQLKNISFLEVKDTQGALGAIACFWRRKFKIPVIAVTGSNGKTTTKEMIAWLLEAKFKVLKNEGTKNNQIGLPMSVLKLRPEHDIAVLEIGTNHFGEVNYLGRICRPNLGVIINIGPVHLEYLNNLEGVLEEKYALISNLRRPAVAILNADDQLLRKKALKKSKTPFIIGFGINQQSDFFASGVSYIPEGLEFTLNLGHRFILKTFGRHNIYNALAGIAVARIFGIEYKDIASRLASFEFPSGRLKFVNIGKINFIDDTYNSNPVSLATALDTLGNFQNKGRKIFVMGDMLELGAEQEGFHYKIGKHVADTCDTFVTVGKLSRLTAQAAGRSGLDTNKIFTCESSKEARDILFNKIAPKEDDLVLIKGSRLMRMEEIFKI